MNNIQIKNKRVLTVKRWPAYGEICFEYYNLFLMNKWRFVLKEFLLLRLNSSLGIWSSWVYIHHVTFFKLISLSMAQFSPVEWIVRRNCLILPTSWPIVPSATPKLSKPPTVKNPSFNCGSFDIARAFLGSSGNISQVVLLNLSLGCSALPDTNLNDESGRGGWKKLRYTAVLLYQEL